MEGTSNRICKPLMGLTVPFSNNDTSQITYKIHDFRYPPSTVAVDGMLCCDERHPLLMKYFKTLHVCIRQI